MTISHKYYLSLGSNIEPQTNLKSAILQLRQYGQVGEISSAWESHAIGFGGPDFVNVCLSFSTELDDVQLKESVLRPIEKALGRTRGLDKNAPRTIDIDIVMVDDQPISLPRWDNAFVIVPMSELLPTMEHPRFMKPMAEIAREIRKTTWIVQRQWTLP